MNKYGKAAVDAVVRIHNGQTNNPAAAWETATENIFGKGTAGQKKGCPKNAFLGLCEDGLIKGIKAGSYTNSTLNKHYALEAVRILKENPGYKPSQRELWDQILNGESKSYNNQMAVVLALWEKGLIGSQMS